MNPHFACMLIACYVVLAPYVIRVLLFLCVGICDVGFSRCEWLGLPAHWPHTNARSQDEDTALMHAVRWGHADCVRLLLDAGADKEAQDNVRDRSPRQNGAYLCISRALFVFIHF